MSIRSITQWAHSHREQIDKAIQGALVITMTAAVIATVVLASQSMGQMRGIHSHSTYCYNYVALRPGHSIASLQHTISGTITAASVVIGSAATLSLYNYFVAKKKMQGTTQALLALALTAAIATVILNKEALHNLSAIYTGGWYTSRPCWSSGKLGRNALNTFLRASVATSSLALGATLLLESTRSKKKGPFNRMG